MSSNVFESNPSFIVQALLLFIDIIYCAEQEYSFTTLTVTGSGWKAVILDFPVQQ